MPDRLKPLAALVAALTCLVLPAAAEATLTFVRDPLNSTVYVAADDGGHARKLGSGSSPHVTPDGDAVVYLHEGPKNRSEMVLAPVGGGREKTVLANWREASQVAISPDSSLLAALRGPELGKRKLVLIDLASGAQRAIAGGYFSGFSFSPEGSELVYARAGREDFPPPSNLFRVGVEGGGTKRLSRDHNSSYPLWGPNGKIVFVRTLDAERRKYGPKNELFLVGENGKGAKRLTQTEVGPLLQGLSPTEWSANGRRLLAEFGGQDTGYAVGVDPRNGSQHPIQKTGELGLIATAISADGKLVLGATGGFDPAASNHRVVAVPYNGGKAKTLAKSAIEPGWSR